MTAFGEVWSDDEFANETDIVELDRFIGAFEGELAVGGSGAYTFRMTVPGGEVGAAGITAVGVLPTHRRRGILRQMMTELFRQATERGEPVAILWASEAAIYQRFGFGMATKGANFEAAKGKIRFPEPDRAGRPGAPRRARRVRRAGGTDLRGAAVDARWRGQPVGRPLAVVGRPRRGVGAVRARPQGARGLRGRRPGARLRDPPAEGRLGPDRAAAHRSRCSRCSGWTRRPSRRCGSGCSRWTWSRPWPPGAGPSRTRCC